MRIVRKSDVAAPFVAPLGEQIFEMIGRPPELGGTSKHSFVHVVIPPGKCSPSHFHKDSEETYYILRGSASMAIDTNRWQATPGMAISIMPGEIHQIINNGVEDLEFLTVSAPAWVPTDTYEADLPEEP
jgi:mannose-6-phosphate isomerase-like protein (cupin superfamily)